MLQPSNIGTSTENLERDATGQFAVTAAASQGGVTSTIEEPDRDARPSRRFLPGLCAIQLSTDAPAVLPNFLEQEFAQRVLARYSRVTTVAAIGTSSLRAPLFFRRKRPI
jgi:hypothetical protein